MNRIGRVVVGGCFALLACEPALAAACPCADTGVCILPAGECDSVGSPVVTPLADVVRKSHRVIRQDAWYGGRRTVFDFRGYEAWVVEPPEGVAAADGRPWTWTMQWKTAFVPRTGVPQLLRRGWHHVTIDTFARRMDPEGLRVSAAFQAYLVNELGLASQANLIGLSWGGFFSTRYAAAYPRNVAKIYLDCPLLDLGGRCGRAAGEDAIGPWAKDPPADWHADPRMPVNLAKPLAAARIPILLAYGGADNVLDPRLNAETFIPRFKAAGGDITVVYRAPWGHHPHGFDVGETTLLDFFAGPEKPNAGADGAGELPPIVTNCEIRVNAALHGKKAFYYCDDVIWLFRDLTRQRPASLFDNPFLKVLREAHDAYGLKVQLNCFYRTDFFYGADEFTLAQMTDAYKAEWQANKDWLKLGFHSLQEFPDYPFINADYADMKRVLDLIGGEIARFAGEGVFAKGAVVHWGTCSKDACRALRDAGFGIVLASCGPRRAYAGDPSVLPYGHAMRLEQNRKGETCLYTRISANEAIASSIGGYNNLTYEQARATYGNFRYVYDRETGIGFKEIEDLQPLAAGINLYTADNLIPTFEKYAGNEFLVYGNHEQYFYRDYLAYQPDYAAKVLAAAKFLKENGYSHFFLEDLVRKPEPIYATIHAVNEQKPTVKD